MQVIIDDRDPGITWFGDWTFKGEGNEYDKTTHGTSQDGASFTFQFVGTSIIVYGTNPTSASETRGVNCSVDGGSSVHFIAPPTNTTEYNQAFCSISSLTPAEHTLMFEAILPQSQGTLYVDYLVYDATPYSLQVPTSSLVYPSSHSTASANVTFTSPSPVRAVGKPSFTAPIAAVGVICTVVLTTAVVLIWWWSRRRPSRRSAIEPAPQVPTTKDLVVLHQSSPASPLPGHTLETPLPTPPPNSPSWRFSSLRQVPGPSSSRAVYNGGSTVQANGPSSPHHPISRAQDNLRMGRQTLQRKLEGRPHT